MEGELELHEIKAVIKRLLAKKKVMNLHQLQNEYQKITKRRIPYYWYGCRTLQSFLKVLQTTCVVINCGDNFKVMGLEDSNEGATKTHEKDELVRLEGDFIEALLLGDAGERYLNAQKQAEGSAVAPSKPFEEDFSEMASGLTFPGFSAESNLPQPNSESWKHDAEDFSEMAAGFMFPGFSAESNLPQPKSESWKHDADEDLSELAAGLMHPGFSAESDLPRPNSNLWKHDAEKELSEMAAKLLLAGFSAESDLPQPNLKSWKHDSKKELSEMASKLLLAGFSAESNLPQPNSESWKHDTEEDFSEID